MTTERGRIGQFQGGALHRLPILYQSALNTYTSEQHQVDLAGCIYGCICINRVCNNN